MKRRAADEIARSFGFESAEAWRRSRAAPLKGTRLGITHALLDLPHVAGFHLVEHPGALALVVTMRWYAWLTFGVLHRRTLARAMAVLVREVSARAEVAVYFKA